MAPHAQDANNFVGGSGGKFVDKNNKPTKLAIGSPQTIPVGKLMPAMLGHPTSLTTENSKKLQDAVGKSRSSSCIISHSFR